MTCDVGGVILQPAFGPATEALSGYLSPLQDAAPDIEVNWASIRLRRPTRTVARNLEVATEGPATLLWRSAAGFPVDLLATWEDGHLSLTASLTRNRQEQVLRRLRPARLPQQLLYLLGIYPAAWVARRRSGAVLVHASAIELDGRGLLMVGPGGVGKSSLAAAALALGGRLISDNLVLATEHEVRGWREPVRLSPGADVAGLVDVGGNGWHGRRDHALATERWTASTVPALVLAPSLADRTSVHPEQDAGAWASRILSLGSLAGELTRWPAFAAAFDTLDSAPVPAPEVSLAALLAGVPLRRVDLSRTGDHASLTQLLQDLVRHQTLGVTAP
jgi:hypothetical protein